MNELVALRHFALPFGEESLACSRHPKIQPIATAPRDGSRFLGYSLCNIDSGMITECGPFCFAWFDQDVRAFRSTGFNDMPPWFLSHWSPFPTPPSDMEGMVVDADNSSFLHPNDLFDDEGLC